MLFSVALQAFNRYCPPTGELFYMLLGERGGIVDEVDDIADLTHRLGQQADQ